MWKDLKFKVFIKLLHWYCSEEMDQWDLIKLEGDEQTFYISLSRSPLDSPEASFRKIKNV